MKTMIRLLTCAVVATMSTQAALNIPSDGSDGALLITANTVIDLSQAVTANWDANNTANAGKGIYDPAKWAVVFKYSNVTVQAGATVTFQNHASRAPVVWLVQGDVALNGTVSLDGQGWLVPPALAEPGPGGFRGGSGNYAIGAAAGAGFGPGGGPMLSPSNWRGTGGSYGSAGVNGGGPLYGNPSLIPLIGGSGGSGANANNGVWIDGGAAGGGALLIASSGRLTISGMVKANGGAGNGEVSGGGSGGGIRLVAETLAGSGIVQALGGQNPYGGGVGRIRIERGTNTGSLSLQVTPGPSVVELPGGATPQIWLPTNGPTARIVSIGGTSVTTDPRAGFGAIAADVAMPRVSSTTVIVETTNAEQASVVSVRATPRSNGNFSEVTATPLLPVISEDPLVIRWTANVPVNDGYSAIQVKVVRP